jgi:hypothetical protein
VHAVPGCHDDSFVDALPDAAWVNIDLQPAQGTGGIRDALRRAQAEYPNQPVRVRLAPGSYADTLGNEVFVQALWRTAAAPLWLQAADGRPGATVLGHGLNLLGVSYVAIDGVTIGPSSVGAWNGQRHADPQPLQAAAGIHVAGVALDARRSAVAGGALDLGVYGRYRASNHVLVRGVTVQNLFDPLERDAETSDSQSMDGMKFNQVQDLWVLDSRVLQTTRHGIDNVGVHRAAFCRNVVSRTGGGLGFEAKGGSVDVLVDGNLFHRVRRVELGGEETDATYYFSSDGGWDHEARRITLRNNLIIDAREAALEFSGCQDCAAISNTIYFSPDYQPPRDGESIYGGDAIRVHDSRILGADDGAGSDCQYWDEALQDHVTVDPCWGVGARAPAPVNRVLRSATAHGGQQRDRVGAAAVRRRGRCGRALPAEHRRRPGTAGAGRQCLVERRAGPAHRGLQHTGRRPAGRPGAAGAADRRTHRRQPARNLAAQRARGAAARHRQRAARPAGQCGGGRAGVRPAACTPGRHWSGRCADRRPGRPQCRRGCSRPRVQLGRTDLRHHLRAGADQPGPVGLLPAPLPAHADLRRPARGAVGRAGAGVRPRGAGTWARWRTGCRRSGWPDTEAGLCPPPCPHRGKPSPPCRRSDRPQSTDNAAEPATGAGPGPCW